ncbi:membrane protein insertion efficiency factor YidD [Aerococcus christensenii]|uniref:Putative membrane protein insertion efficiency factor n=1 Tax=Aerococcus christensenii TaxID=87541 RepID=A0A120I8P2_9LACT|nr:membrane protein insertion efficiency factor YidD [Aerococcus christensenii]AMB92410.1 membrane protein insertion efficiency factor YidD [Aerococcus christensenii]KXB36575.1 hypothetical protein HMPREF3187_00749 [Aerococcus christensenii]MDK8234206.1 membrane protein insertion efficiency factor YidD [Aerococcus christensenii]PKY90832.1 membrane protein insertion efficiency factor YidD [Aerococcus christensenii]WEB71037.1 membrane protein insertion efficiency factor YidD [Aerococcus christen
MNKVFIKGVLFYQKWISPLFSPSCRYFPTCSNYMLQSLAKYGAFKGGLMGIFRILRCHPLAKGGVDPVPDTFSWKKSFKSKDNNHFLL